MKQQLAASFGKFGRGVLSWHTLIGVAALIGIGLWGASQRWTDFAQYDTVTFYSILATFASLWVTYITYEVAQSIISYKELNEIKRIFTEIRSELIREGAAAKKLSSNDKSRIEVNIASYYTVSAKKRTPAVDTKIKILQKAVNEKRPNVTIADLIAQINNLITL